MPKSNITSKKYSGSKTSKLNSSQKKIKKSLSQKNYGGSKTSKPLEKSKKVEWSPIPEWTKYQASTDGEIRNFWTEKILKKQISGGYYRVKLSGAGNDETCLVHRLVAITYLPNPKNLPVVDHINNNKLDNRLENLRWVTVLENNESFNKNFRKKKCLRAILQYDKNGTFIRRWKSITQILKGNPKYRKGAIYCCMRGESKTAYGYIWKYEIPIKKINNTKNFRKIGIYVGLKNIYDLSNYGASENGDIINIKKSILVTQRKNDAGYMVVRLFCLQNKKIFNIYVHRLIAYIYIQGYDLIKKNQVNHIDKNRSNNYYKNLEWVTQQENNAHSRGKAVKMIDIDTSKIINIFMTVADACRYLERPQSGRIGVFCNGNPNLKSVYGYKWAWLEKDEVIDKPIMTIPIKKN